VIGGEIAGVPLEKAIPAIRDLAGNGINFLKGGITNIHSPILDTI